MKQLQISQKAQLLVAVALSALLFVGGFAWVQTSRLHSAMTESQVRHENLVGAVDHGLSAQVSFKTMVQQWKNILLRGKNSEAFDKHVKEFNEQNLKVRDSLKQLKEHVSALGLGNEIKVEDIMATFDKLAPQYLDALKQYDRESADPATTVDKLVKGMDRPPQRSAGQNGRQDR